MFDLFMNAAINYSSNIADFKAFIEKKAAENDVFKLESKKYLERLQKVCGCMRIFGMAEPVPLDNIYINVRLTNQISSRRRVYVDDRENLISWDKEISKGDSIGGRDLINRFDRVLVLGRPGAGKTTLLKYLAMSMVKREVEPDKIPVYVSMKHWADSGYSLFEYVVIQFEECGLLYADEFVRATLKSGGFVFLLDGYDEVYSVKGFAVSEINSLCSMGVGCKFVLSCRISANDHVFESFTEVEVSDFCDDQIFAFIDKYFYEKSLASLCRNDLCKDENYSIKALAKTPLLLTLICISYSESMGLPPSKTELYKEALEALLKKWDASRSIKRDGPYRELTVNKKETLFGIIAYQTFSRNEQYFERPYLEKMIDDYMSNLIPDDYENDSEVVVRSIESQHGLLVERAHNIYSFSHLTFQEYFFAHHIVFTQSGRGMSKFIKDNLLSGKWAEVFSIISSLLPDASTFIGNISNQVRSIRIGREARDALLLMASISYDEICPLPISRALSLRYVLEKSVAFSDTAESKTALSHAESLSDSLQKLYKKYICKDLIESQVLKLGMSGNRGALDEMGERLGRAYLSGGVENLSSYLYGNKILMSSMLSDCYMLKSIRTKEIDDFLLGLNS